MSVTTTAVASIVTRVRYLIGDSDSSDYRSDNDEMAIWLTDAQRQVVMRRPEAYITSGSQHTGAATPLPGAVSFSTPNFSPASLETHPYFDDAIVDYVSYRAFSKDSDQHEANPDGKAGIHYDKFLKAVTR